MNAVELMQFLGHASVYGPFEDFLSQHGVKKRPDVTGKNLELWIGLKKTGLYLAFEMSVNTEEKEIAVRSSGDYIFRGVDIYLQKHEGMTPYTGPLPFGLEPKMNQEQVRSILGSPKFFVFDNEWNNNTDFFYISDVVVCVKYADMEGTQILILDLRVPSDWDRERGIAPQWIGDEGASV
ncbi:MAG: hypothetical protein Q4G30_06245 [Actinomycetaceae bacterium]|nr:hypothetical protein [Actinomycetaceae bacterium]